MLSYVHHIIDIGNLEPYGITTWKITMQSFLWWILVIERDLPRPEMKSTTLCKMTDYVMQFYFFRLLPCIGNIEHTGNKFTQQTSYYQIVNIECVILCVL